jgi:hypothetical protein
MLATRSPLSQVAQLGLNIYIDCQQNITSGSSVVNLLEARRLITKAVKNKVYARVRK